MTLFSRSLLGAGLLLALAGCNTTPPAIAHSPSFEPVFPAEKETAVAATGAIYAGNYDSLFGHGRSYHVGDIVTVVLDETATAKRSQNNQLSRAATNTALSAAGKAFAPLAGPSTTTSKGAGEADQAASLDGSITVTVFKVMANGNLVLRGEKQLALTEGTEVMQLAGIARPEDISPNNTMQSHRLANAQITYRGTGDMANATSAGWGTSVLLKVWPF
jgi:flagellar L-ring protein precursor FlgH